MKKMDLNKARMALEELLEQRKSLQFISESFGNSASSIRTLSYTEEIMDRIHRGQQQFDEEQFILEQLAEALSAVLAIYTETEERIAGAYEEEQVKYPAVSIGLSKVSIYKDLHNLSVIRLE